MDTCRVCGAETDVIVNINLRDTPVCDPCCISIALQTVRWLAEQYREMSERKAAE